MKGNSYSYFQRQGVRLLTWEDLYEICKSISIAVAKYDPDVILGIARGGLYPGTLISHMLQKDFYPIKLTRRQNDIVVSEHPVWVIKPPELIKNKKVLVVDEVCDSGETLEMAKEEALKIEPDSVKTAVLYSHKKGEKIPDFIGLITDELVLNPWDREVYRNGDFVIHPEYTEALKEQNIASCDGYLIKAKLPLIAKG